MVADGLPVGRCVRTCERCDLNGAVRRARGSLEDPRDGGGRRGAAGSDVDQVVLPLADFVRDASYSERHTRTRGRAYVAGPLPPSYARTERIDIEAEVRKHCFEQRIGFEAVSTARSLHHLLSDRW